MVGFREMEDIGRIQLSKSFYLRDFLQSEIASCFRLSNIPVNLDEAIFTGRKLCETILEPLQDTFGRIHIRSGYRSPSLNNFGSMRGLKCSRNERTYADHIWDVRDAEGYRGACACIVVPWFTNQGQLDDWPTMARWLCEHIDFHRVVFFSLQGAFNIGWRENPQREISSYRTPRGRLTKDSATRGWGDHPGEFDGYPSFRGIRTPLDDVSWAPPEVGLSRAFLPSAAGSMAPPEGLTGRRKHTDEPPRVSRDLFADGAA